MNDNIYILSCHFINFIKEIRHFTLKLINPKHDGIMKMRERFLFFNFQFIWTEFNSKNTVIIKCYIFIYMQLFRKLCALNCFRKTIFYINKFSSRSLSPPILAPILTPIAAIETIHPSTVAAFWFSIWAATPSTEIVVHVSNFSIRVTYTCTFLPAIS